MTNSNVEIRILAHEKGLYKSYALEESENQGKGGAKPTIPQQTESQLDEYF